MNEEGTGGPLVRTPVCFLRFFSLKYVTFLTPFFLTVDKAGVGQGRNPYHDQASDTSSRSDRTRTS